MRTTNSREITIYKHGYQFWKAVETDFETMNVYTFILGLFRFCFNRHQMFELKLFFEFRDMILKFKEDNVNTETRDELVEEYLQRLPRNILSMLVNKLNLYCFGKTSFLPKFTDHSFGRLISRFGLRNFDDLISTIIKKCDLKKLKNKRKKMVGNVAYVNCYKLIVLVDIAQKKIATLYSVNDVKDYLSALPMLQKNKK